MRLSAHLRRLPAHPLPPPLFTISGRQRGLGKRRLPRLHRLSPSPNRSRTRLYQSRLPARLPTLPVPRLHMLQLQKSPRARPQGWEFLLAGWCSSSAQGSLSTTGGENEKFWSRRKDKISRLRRRRNPIRARATRPEDVKLPRLMRSTILKLWSPAATAAGDLFSARRVDSRGPLRGNLLLTRPGERGLRRNTSPPESCDDAAHGPQSCRPGRARSLHSCWLRRGASTRAHPDCAAA